LQRIKEDDKKGLQKEDKKAVLNSALVGDGLSEVKDTLCRLLKPVADPNPLVSASASPMRAGIAAV